MNELPLAWHGGLVAEHTQHELEKMNQKIEGHGLTLRAEEMRALALRHTRVLQNTGRIEFGESILPKLVFAFCDSPYIPPADFASVIEELMECFYHFKNETMEQMGDDQLLDYMKKHFDGEAHGSIDYLCGTVLERLAEQLRFGTKPDGEDEQQREPEEQEGMDEEEY